MADPDVLMKHVGIFLPLPRAAARHYGLKPEDDSDPHVTILYLGDQPPEMEEPIKRAVQAVVDKWHPFKVAGSGLDYFKTDEHDVAFTPVRGVELHILRQQLANSCRHYGVEWTDSYPEYRPHVTLQYLDKGKEWDGDPPSWDFLADKLSVWGFDRDHDFAFGRAESLPRTRIRLVCERMVSQFLQR